MDDIWIPILLVFIVLVLVYIFRPSKFRFEPGVFFNEQLRITEIVIADTSVVWTPLPCGFQGHWVDLGYDFDGKLVAIRVWDDIRVRSMNDT